MADDSSTPRERFTALTRGGAPIDLARAALEIARIGHPTLDPAPSLETLSGLADAARPRIESAGSPDARALALSRFLFEECGFRGNQQQYYDPRNSFLNDVLDRRTGIPISLSLLVIEVGRRLGVPAEGVGFPGHFLVRVGVPDGFLVFDPFFGGRLLDEATLLERLAPLRPGQPPLTRLPPELLHAVAPTDLLARMLRNLLQIYTERQAHLEALHAVDLVLVLQPNAPDELCRRGMLYEQLECDAAAIADYRRVLDLVPAGPERDRIRRRLTRLQRSSPPMQ